MLVDDFFTHHTCGRYVMMDKETRVYYGTLTSLSLQEKSFFFFGAQSAGLPAASANTNIMLIDR